MEFKIPFHSVIDIITNSSTEIFTYSGSSIGAFKELITEMFKIHGVDKSFDDVFIATISCDDYVYSESDLCPEDVSHEDVKQLLEDIKSGKIEKPKWMDDVEEEEDSWSYYMPSTYLVINTKDDKYEQFAKLAKSFLYSTDHEATRNG